jgi:predicted metal-dependent hydrolase
MFAYMNRVEYGSGNGSLYLAVTHAMKLDWNLGALANGLRCYRSQEFFLAHEHWESVWLNCQEPEKSFLQALIQMAAAFHHLQRNNSHGATSLLKAALRKLETYPPLFESVEVTSLREEIGAWLEVLEAPSSAIHPPLPQIRLTSLSV